MLSFGVKNYSYASKYPALAQPTHVSLRHKAIRWMCVIPTHITQFLVVEIIHMGILNMEVAEKKAHITPSSGNYLHSWETQTVLTCGSANLCINNDMCSMKCLFLIN